MKSRIGRRRSTVLASLLLVVSLAVAATARGATVVVLVRAPRPSPVTAEATVRLRGELASAGFEVRVVDPPMGGDIRASLEQAAAGSDVEAVVAILGDEPGDAFGDSAELWVIDRVTGKTVVRRVPNQTGSTRAAEVLSIRALELLRASFLEVALAAGRTPRIVPQPPPPEVSRFADKALDEAIDNRPHAGWAMEVGGSVLGNLQGLTPALVPIARLQRSLGDHFLVRVTLAGLGTRSHLESPSGTGEVSQQFGLAEVALRWRTDKLFQPFFSAGAGALHVAAVGQPASPNDQGLTRDRWAFLADAGAGLRVPIAGPFELAWEVHAQVAQPYPTVRFFDVEVASVGRLARPTLIGSLTVIAWM